jgi:hypothetical protein
VLSQLPNSRSDTRVLTHADAADIAMQVPDADVPGAGGLPQPRSSLEAAFMVADARAKGIYSFWAGSPDTTNGDVTTHWVTADNTELVYRKGLDESRCILVASSSSSVLTKMFARLEPCNAKMADGVLTVAAAAAPPPPPGSTASGLYDPLRAPPPPPSTKDRALLIFKRNVMFASTEAVCSGKLGEGHVHRLACEAFLDRAATFQHIVGYGSGEAPLCREWCWHECSGSHVGGHDDDTFVNCQRAECASSSCYTFLLQSCPPAMHAAIETKYKETCTIVPPSPPTPPAPPPLPPRPPFAPSPAQPPPHVKFVQRSRDGELDSDPACEPVPYADCVEIVRQFAQANGAGYRSDLRVTAGHCEGLPNEVDCFIGTIRHPHSRLRT